MINWTDKLKSAAKYASDAHKSIGQKRKYTGEDYFESHCMEVANIVSEYTNDEDLIIVAFFHDIFEDVGSDNADYGYIKVYDTFGATIERKVWELTKFYTKLDYPTLTRYERHILESDRLSRAQPDSKLVKMADILSNTKDVVKMDKQFAKTYLKEKLHVLPFLKEGNEQLFNKVLEQVNREYEKVKA
jgi:guanosine-3',5'-bis(diphosphate) 3'-pyrophosphohydrolase